MLCSWVNQCKSSISTIFNRKISRSCTCDRHHSPVTRCNRWWCSADSPPPRRQRWGRLGSHRSHQTHHGKVCLWTYVRWNIWIEADMWSTICWDMASCWFPTDSPETQHKLRIYQDLEIWEKATQEEVQQMAEKMGFSSEHGVRFRQMLRLIRCLKVLIGGNRGRFV